MTDKELLKQLNSLKSIKMDSELKESNKRVLMTQISNTISDNFEVKSFNNFFFYFRNILSMSSKPAMVLSGVFLFVVTSLFLGNDFYKDSKPNDSLYIARVISERARLNTVFNNIEREKLEMEFASKHAEDIATLLMDPEFNNEENKEEVAKLSASFRSEIEKVRVNVKKTETAEMEKQIEEQKDTLVFSASNLKDENGIDISIPEENFLNSTSLIDETDSVSSTSVEATDYVASTSLEIESLGDQIEELSEQINLENNQEVQKDKKDLIEEIERLFNEGRYSEVVLKLQEIK
ncbi:hypothetical protein M0Q39_01225 [Patescibacteria group bacterium]|nr:hypothetical protein [Patescibacteria group bacterium]